MLFLCLHSLLLFQTWLFNLRSHNKQFLSFLSWETVDTTGKSSGHNKVFFRCISPDSHKDPFLNSTCHLLRVSVNNDLWPDSFCFPQSLQKNMISDVRQIWQKRKITAYDFIWFKIFVLLSVIAILAVNSSAIKLHYKIFVFAF